MLGQLEDVEGGMCRRGRAIGGDALAMQVHACMTVRHLPTLVSGSTAHARLDCAYGPLQGRSGDAMSWDDLRL